MGCTLHQYSSVPATMAATTLPQPVQPNLGAIAPAWHTVTILLVLFGISALGARQQSLPSAGRAHGHVASYVFVMVMEWALTAFIWFGIRRRGLRLQDLIGGSWPSVRAVLRDLGIAVLYLIAANLLLSALGWLLKVTP